MGPALSGEQGKTGSWTVTVAQDLTGWTPRFVAKLRSAWRTATDDTGAVLTATTGSGLTLTPGATSTIAIVISAATMAAVTPDVYVWEIGLTKGSEVRTLEWDANGSTVGSLTIEPAVVKATP